MAGYIGSKSSVTLVDGYTEAQADAEFVNDPNSVITVSGSNVGIGTASPAGVLHANSSGHTKTYITSGTSNDAQINFGDSDDNDIGGIHYDNAQNSMKFLTSAAERMRIDASGNLLVGTTNSSLYNQSSDEGMVYRAGNSLDVSRASGQPLILNRLTNDGTIADFRKDGAVVGSIGTLYGDLTIGTGDTGIKFTDSSNYLVPFNPSTTSERDNAISLGQPTTRFEDAFITNGVTTGSDANDKQDIATLTATEMLVAARLSQTFRTYRWKDKVVEKGDNARTHTGTIAQEVQAAFTAEGLDAGDYAMFMSDTWWETQTEVPAVEAVEAVDAVTETTTDEDGNEVVTVITEAVEAVEAKDAYTRIDHYHVEAEAPEGSTERTRLGIRYPELLSFVAAYNEQRFASIEARLTALEDV